MLKDNQYTRIDDSQIIEKTGKPSTEWYTLLDNYEAPKKPSKEVCDYLIQTYDLSKYWARTIYIRYQWARDLRFE
jgi:hypothetical protein